jgi:hypothetical protein
MKTREEISEYYSLDTWPDRMERAKLEVLFDIRDLLQSLVPSLSSKEKNKDA